jgi:hypothetical protein
MQPASRFSTGAADLIVPTFTRNVKVGQSPKHSEEEYYGVVRCQRADNAFSKVRLVKLFDTLA